jgi:16S rRNA (cytosine967-C5)-methyltransferase
MRTPDHAAVSASVAAAPLLGYARGRALVNAVLRRFLRERDALEEQLQPAAAAAMPGWLWAALEGAWPAQRAQISEASAARPPMTLRVNRRHLSREQYRQRLTAAGMAATPGSLCADALTLGTPCDVEMLPGFAQGDVSVQDEAAQLAARLMAPQPGERILDGCAAPGGKTGHLLEYCEDIALVACDKSADRLQRVQDNLQRLGRNAQLLTADLTAPPQALKDLAPFDGILLDVPCSASGVLRRHPDIKLLRRREDIGGFRSQQLAILKGSWPLLRNGGRLLYVTCSILPAENSELVAQFLRETPDASERSLAVPGALACQHGWQCLPSPGAADGLYFALLGKAEPRGA